MQTPNVQSFSSVLVTCAFTQIDEPAAIGIEARPRLGQALEANSVSPAMVLALFSTWSTSWQASASRSMPHRSRRPPPHSPGTPSWVPGEARITIAGVWAAPACVWQPAMLPRRPVSLVTRQRHVNFSLTPTADDCSTLIYRRQRATGAPESSASMPTSRPRAWALRSGRSQLSSYNRPLPVRL